MQRGVYLVGSVPLADAAEVFTTAADLVGERLHWVPDGETGARLSWINSLDVVFAANPAFVPTGVEFRHHAQAAPKPRFRLAPGCTVADIRFDNLPYARDAIASWQELRRLQQAGRVPRAWKFQADLVPSFSVIRGFLEEDLHGAVDPIWNDAVRREIDRIAAVIPAGELAIQFDVASAIFARLQLNQPTIYGADRNAMLEHFAGVIATLANHVPAGADLLFHFCYGDSGHKHAVEPIDIGDMVDMANLLTARIARPIQLIHMPVPRDRDDAAYFAPLRRLQLGPATKLCLGLIHLTGGIEGTRRRMRQAEQVADDFLIATECGFGRRDPATVRELLRLHAVAADR